MVELATELSASLSVRFPFLVDSKDIPFFQQAAAAIPGIDTITPGQPKTADSNFVPIEITGPNITGRTVPLLAETANFLSGKSSALHKAGQGQEAIDAALKAELASFIAGKLSKPIPVISDVA